MALHSQDSFASIQLFTNNWPQGLALLNVLVTVQTNNTESVSNMNESLNETAASEIGDLCATGLPVFEGVKVGGAAKLHRNSVLCAEEAEAVKHFSSLVQFDANRLHTIG